MPSPAGSPTSGSGGSAAGMIPPVPGGSIGTPVLQGQPPPAAVAMQLFGQHPTAVPGALHGAAQQYRYQTLHPNPGSPVFGPGAPPPVQQAGSQGHHGYAPSPLQHPLQAQLQHHPQAQQQVQLPHQ